MLVKFEQNRMVQIFQNFVIWQKIVNNFWRVDAILEDVSVSATIVADTETSSKMASTRQKLCLQQLLDPKILIQRLSSFSVLKITALRHV